jgi:ADP-ribose pyrophosphatase
MGKGLKSKEKILNRELLYAGSYLTLEKLLVRLPNRQVCDREVVRVRNAVAVLPVDKEGNVHLVRQFRPAIEQLILEAPAGLMDGNENPEQTAFRECEEETGYKPRKLQKLLTYAHAEGYSTGFITLFLGTELEHTGNIHLDSSEFLEPVIMPFAELVYRVQTNQIVDSKTILCTLLSHDKI